MITLTDVKILLFPIEIQTSEAALMSLSLSDLSHQAELVILGTVIDKKPTFHRLLNHTLSIDKIFNGSYAGNTISVVGQPPGVVEDAVDMKKGERVILFLYKEKSYDGQYAVVGTQGKYDVDLQGQVHGYNLPRVMSIGDLERCMTDKVCSSASNVNSSRISYANDTDLKLFNESNMAKTH
jgi:hypothetical protein